MVKKKKSAFRASFTRLRFKGKAWKKNTAQSMVAGTVKIKKITTSVFSLCATRQECALSFSFTFSFIAFICVLRLCAFPFVIGSSIVFSWFVRHGFFLFFSLHWHAYMYIYIYIYIYTCSLRAYHIVYSASGLGGGTLYGRNAVFNTFRHTRRHTFSGLSIWTFLSTML